MSRLRVGDPAPDFRLPGIDGRTGEEITFHLTRDRTGPLVVAFYPADGSPVCTAQLAAYTEHFGLLAEAGASLVAISPQSVESHRSFAAQQGGFAFPLLSDEDRAVGASYGILGLLDLYRRSTFVIDPDGCLCYVHRSIGPGLTFPTVDRILGILAECAES